MPDGSEVELFLFRFRGTVRDKVAQRDSKGWGFVSQIFKNGLGAFAKSRQNFRQGP